MWKTDTITVLAHTNFCHLRLDLDCQDVMRVYNSVWRNVDLNVKNQILNKKQDDDNVE